MKIDNSSPITRLIQGEQGKPADKTVGTATGSSSQASPATITHLSQLAQNPAQDIDLSRVEEVRTAIREGKLELSPEKIADGLIDSVRAMLDQEGEQ